MIIVSCTFSNCEKLNSWLTTPSLDLASGKFSSTSTPHMDTSPAFFVTRDEIIPIAVDFPAPFGPKSAKKSPFSTDRLISFNA